MKNQSILRIVLFSFCLFVLFIGCKQTDRKVDNINAFAKVYGYVRWFYPGDEASQIDWNKFAVYGIRNVENARSQKELKEKLTDLFKPIAPALKFVNTNQEFKFDVKSITPVDTSGLSCIFWMNYGVGLSPKSNVYKSFRYNRDTTGLIKPFANHYLKIGDNIKRDISKNLAVIMPLALYGNQQQTFPISDTLSLKQLQNNLSKIAVGDLNTKDYAVRLANVVIAWNVLQHFYPYFDVVKVDWNKELLQTLHHVYKGKTQPDYFVALSEMVAKLEDGHGIVYSNVIEQWGFPYMVDLIQNNVVVTESEDIRLFRKGDIIKSIDGRSAINVLKDHERLISGSSQLKRYRALNMFGSDFSKSEAHVVVMRGGKKIKIVANRETRCNLFFSPSFEGFKPIFSDLGDSIYYLNNYPCEENGVMDKLVHAKGIIINNLASENALDFIAHIVKEPVRCAKWYIPINTYPDRLSTFYDTSGRWNIEPKQPYFKAKLIFLTHPYNVSFGETVLGIVDNYKLGRFVGDATAATNGDANFINLMGGYTIMWTGLKVLKHDGSQHHLIGFKPDFPISRTLKAVDEGRDEYLEKAKEILEEELRK